MRLPLPILLAAAALAAPAHAAAPGPLVVESRVLIQQKHTAADGSVEVMLSPAAKVVPGDKVVYALSYRNVGTQPIADIVLSNPLPSAIAYRAPAAGSPAPELSVDGKTFAALADLTVAAADGSRRAATANDVTHVRWKLAAPLPAGGKGQFAFQAILK